MVGKCKETYEKSRVIGKCSHPHFVVVISSGFLDACCERQWLLSTRTN